MPETSYSVRLQHCHTAGNFHRRTARLSRHEGAPIEGPSVSSTIAVIYCTEGLKDGP